jgi:hypothetical protein
VLLAAKIAGRGRAAGTSARPHTRWRAAADYPDHIRRVTRMAVYSLIGPVIATVAGGVIAIAAGIAGGAWGALVTAA